MSAVRTVEDLVELRDSGATRFVGDFLLEDTGVRVISLPCVIEISGTFRVLFNSDLLRIELPALERFSGRSDTTFAEPFVIRQNGRLTRTDLPSLESVDGGMRFQFNPQLASIDLSGLRTHSGALPGSPCLSFSGTRAMTVLSLPRLQEAWGVCAIGTSFERLDLPALDSVDWLYIANNDALLELSLPELTTVKQVVQITNNDLLESVAALSGVTSDVLEGGVNVLGNDRLASYEGLEGIGDRSASDPILGRLRLDNASICLSEAESLRDLLDAKFPGTLTQTGIELGGAAC